MLRRTDVGKSIIKSTRDGKPEFLTLILIDFT